MIKRVGASIAAVGLLLTLVPAAVSAAPAAPVIGEFKGAACLDIVSGTGTLTGTATNQPVVNFTMTMAAPTCKNSSYTVTAQDDFTVPTVVGSQTLQGDGASTSLTFQFAVPNDLDGLVCVVGTTGKGAKAGDVAPDLGCLELADNLGSSGGQGFH